MNNRRVSKTESRSTRSATGSARKEIDEGTQERKKYRTQNLLVPLAVRTGLTARFTAVTLDDEFYLFGPAVPS